MRPGRSVTTGGSCGGRDTAARVSDANVVKSMLPPETMATMRPRARPVSAAATAHAAAPSAITWQRSATMVMALATSVSGTTIDSSTTRDSSGHIVGSTDLPPAPSTNDACQPSK